MGSLNEFPMYIFKSDTPDGADEYLSKSSKNLATSSSTAEGVLARLQIAPIVPAQIASISGSFAPTSAVLSSIAESITAAGAISNIGRPVSEDYAIQAANEESNNTLVASLEAFSKNLLANANEASLAIVPIASLSDTSLGQIPTAVDNQVQITAASVTSVALPIEHVVVDVSTLPVVSAPVVITALSDSAITVIDSGNNNVQIQDFVAPLVTTESFVNTGAGTLTVTTAATHVASLSLSGNVAYTALADEVTSGITVSGQSDASNVTLFLVGGASNAQGSSDFITLGNGNDFVFDAGDGQVLLNLGSGQNTVILAGVGVTGVVNLAAHDSSVADMIALAANGLSSPHDLANNALVTVAGLNNNAQGQDVITFLGDMDSQLVWAQGSATGAQVTHVSGDAASLESWVSAAQLQAGNEHSVAWFHFAGNTYVLETAAGASGNHTGDTLVKLTGLTQFTNTDGELSIGMLHLAG